MGTYEMLYVIIIGTEYIFLDWSPVVIGYLLFAVN